MSRTHGTFPTIGTSSVPCPPGASRRRIAAGACAALALACLLTLSSIGRAQEESGLRRLAERLVAPWGAPGEVRATLHVAALPDDLDVELPLPATLDLVGSLARYERDAMVSLQVVLDGPPRTAAAFEALRNTFAANDWVVIVEDHTAGGGFVPTMPALFARACAPGASRAGRPVAFVSASPGMDGAFSDIRIDLTRDAWEGACAPTDDRHLERFAPLPTLAAPERGEVTVPLVAHEADDATALAVLRGGGELTDIVAHYEAEVIAAGWSRLPGGVTTDFGTRSPWLLTTEAGRPWVGVLMVDRPTRTGPVMLSFSVVAEPGP